MNLKSDLQKKNSPGQNTVNTIFFLHWARNMLILFCKIQFWMDLPSLNLFGITIKFWICGHRTCMHLRILPLQTYWTGIKEPRVWWGEDGYTLLYEPGDRNIFTKIYIIHGKYWDGVPGPWDKINTRRRPWNNSGKIKHTNGSATTRHQKLQHRGEEFSIKRAKRNCT